MLKAYLILMSSASVLSQKILSFGSISFRLDIITGIDITTGIPLRTNYLTNIIMLRDYRFQLVKYFHMWRFRNTLPVH